MKPLPPNAHDIMVKRYALRNEKNEPVESPKDIFSRAARVVAQAENNFRDGVTPNQVEAKFMELLEDLRFLPNGRTLANAGTSNGQLANCFVLPIDDDLGKTEDGIFSILKKAVMILQSGGGVGFSFGRIRPKGDNAGKGKATGAVSFIKVFDTAFWVIGQGGGRRSACMAVLPVWHPDIEDFITCKEKEGVIEHFNISVGITDAFMEAVEKDKSFDLINPRNKQVWKTVKARGLFNKIVEHAHHNGEPGVLFIDAANRDNPVPNQYYLEATNPCGEQFLGPYENCCMASINLAEHIKAVPNSKFQALSKSKLEARNSKLFNAVVDWDKLKETVVWTVRWLDNVVEANSYVPVVPELKEAAHKNRRIGISIMGLADMFYSLGVRYGANEAIDLAGQIMEFIRFESMAASIQLARERGSFPGIQGSIYDYSHDNAGFWGNVIRPSNTFKIPKPIKPYKFEFNRPKLDWKNLVKNLKNFGIRNSCQTTIQPTGAIATISGLEGYGCEPVFALSYIMKTHEGAKDGSDWAEITYESNSFKEALKRYSLINQEKSSSKLHLNPKVINQIFSSVRQKGSCQNISEIPKEIRDVFVVSSDVKVDEHVMMQAALQAFTDNAISKTINFPAGASIDQVKEAYVKGWKMGLKGMTVYVTGSRETVVLETPNQKSKSNPQKPINPETVTASHVLRTNAEPFATESGISGKPLKREYQSYPDAKLEKINSSQPDSESCPECSSPMILQEGCMHCPSCGYAKCGA